MPSTATSPVLKDHPTTLGVVALLASVFAVPLFGLASPLLAVGLLLLGWSLRGTEAHAFGNWLLASGAVVALLSIGMYAGLGTSTTFTTTEFP